MDTTGKITPVYNKLKSSESNGKTPANRRKSSSKRSPVERAADELYEITQKSVTEWSAVKVRSLVEKIHKHFL